MPTKVRVFRKGPADKKARYDLFQVELRPAETVLDVLHDILHEQDPTLAFRRSCRSAICGSCAMRINGRARLACNTQAAPLADRDKQLLIEPLNNLRVVKDLAVDMGGFWKSMRAVRPALVERKQDVPKAHYAIPGSEFHDLKIVQDCIMCSACLSDCTVREVNPRYLGPAALAKAFRFLGDPRDGATASRLELYAQPDGIWDCDSCLMCNEVCPMGVKPLDAILKMREAAIEHGLVEGAGPGHTLAFYESVVQSGKVNEATTALQSLGVRMFTNPGNLGVAGRAFLRGKTPRLRHRRLRSHDEVQRLIRHVQRG
jgi:succinate dehydrogenase / fumarate reductase iron-sulfur subunit